MEEQTPNYKLRVTETCTSTGLTKFALNLGLNLRSSYVFDIRRGFEHYSGTIWSFILHQLGLEYSPGGS